MKLLQKLILPVLFLAAILIIYIFYFAPDKGLDSFSDLDPNNTASKQIVVEFVKDRPVENQQGASVFYASDKNGKVVMIQGPAQLPPGLENSESITLTGHLHNEYFHAHEVTIN